MRYLLIDRIERLEINKTLTAIKSVALSEDIYADHFVGSPVTPGAMLIESLAQAGTALLEVSNNFEKKALLVIVEQAKFRNLVRPGDQLLIAVAITSLSEDSAQMDGTIHVKDRLVTDARLTFALKPSKDFYPPRTRHLVDAIYETWLREAEIIGTVK